MTTPTLKVRFTQEVTVHPPDDIDTKVEAHNWFEFDPERIIRDAIDLSHGNIEVLEIND